MTMTQQWESILAEHEDEVAKFAGVVRRLPAEEWTRSPSAGKWSPAAVALHVCMAYEFGAAAAAGGAPMRMRVNPLMAWAGRVLLLPLSLATRQFPRGASAPREVRPDPALVEQLDAEGAAMRLAGSAQAAATALHGAEPGIRIGHAYFGMLTPRSTLRLLSAHTRHHRLQLENLAAAARVREAQT
jgi:hypothetical protein